MWFLKKIFFAFLFILGFSDIVLQAQSCHLNSTSLLCLFKVNVTENCNYLKGNRTELGLLLNEVPFELCQKLFPKSLADFTIEEIIKLPKNLIYFIPISELSMLSGSHLAALLIIHEEDTALAKKIIQSVLADEQHIEFLNFLVSKLVTNYKVLDFIGETVYKWNYDVKDGKFQKLSNICGHAIARLWAPYVLTRTKPISTRLLSILAEVEQKKNYRVLCNKYTQVNWKNLPRNIRRVWSFLAVNQSYSSPFKKWTVEQIARYSFLLPDFNIDELLRLIPFDELSKIALHDIDFDKSQARFLFSLLMENSTLKDVKILSPKFFFKLSPIQINEFEPKEWAKEKSAISSLENTYLSYVAAKQIFNKIASDWLSSKINLINGWTSEDLRHLPLLYTQPASSFLKFCSSPPNVQTLITIDSYMLTDRQAYYLSGCSSMFSFHKNDPKLLLGLKYMIKSVPVSSLLNIDIRNINYQVTSHLVSLVSDHNLPMALHLINISNPVRKNYFIEEMLKNKHNVLFEQLAPLDVPGPIFDVLKHLYLNFSDRIDKLPKHMLAVILENDELLYKWIGNESTTINGLYNGYTCNFIKKINSIKFIDLISNYNAYLKRNGKVFPKNLQICVAEAFINYLQFKSKLTAVSISSLYLETWEIEAVQGFVLSTLSTDFILNSTSRDDIVYAIGQLSYPEIMIASQPEKLSFLVDQYVSQILKNKTSLSYEHIFILGNLVHFIPTSYLNSIDEQAFKFLIEADLFDTRICVDSPSKHKWANLIIKAFGNLENWTSDTLVTLSDFLIVLNHDQLNTIPNMSRLNSADIIKTRYADEIEWFSDNIPFYKACEIFLDNQYMNFINSLSDLINFHLISIQIQLQMISPINDNRQNEEIIKSSEARPKVFKPTILVPIPGSDNILKISPKNFFDNFFAGKEKQNVTNIHNKNENIQVETSSVIETSVNQKILRNTESSSILEIENFTTMSSLSSTLNSSVYKENLKNFENNLYLKKFDITFVPLTSTTDNYYNTLNVTNITNFIDTQNNFSYEKNLPVENTEVNVYNFQEETTVPFIAEKSQHIENNLISSSLNINSKNNFQNIKNDAYNISSNYSIPSEFIEISTIGDYLSNINYEGRKKRSLELFFNSVVQVNISCEALKVLGPISVIFKKFDSIIYSMNDDELEDCAELLGSFDINPQLATYVWSKIKDKTALHTYGSVLSGLSVDDIKSIDLDINKPWSLELINLLSKHVTTISIRKEITKQFMMKRKVNMPSHLWGSFGSLICQLQPRIFKIFMPNKELFWKTSPAFNSIKTCDMPCIQNLASIAVSVIGPATLWKAAEVERMGIILSGINITQWQLLLNFNIEALEGLSPSTIKCFDENQIKLMNNSHMKYLTPKSAYTVLEIHSKSLDIHIKETLLKLVNYEIKVDLQSMPGVVIQKNVKDQKYFKDNNSKNDIIYAYESANDISSNKMQAISKASKSSVLLSPILCVFIILSVLK